MPRKKIIDTNEIRWEKIDQEIIEKKNCLGVHLVFNSPLSQRQWHTMRTYLRIDTDESELTANRKINNSWKGLVMLLLSLIYCKYGKSTVATLIRRNDFAGKKYTSYLITSWDYEVFLDDDEQTKLHRESTVPLSSDEFVLLFNKDVKKGFQEGIRQQEKTNLRKLLIDLPPNPAFEQIAVPPSWRPCYVKANYDPMYIEGNMMVLAKLLDLDIKNSIVTTEYYKDTLFSYASNPAKFQDTSDLLCSCPAEFCFTYGIEIVAHEVFFSNLAGKYVQVIDPRIPPSEIENRGAPIYGYSISASTVKRLCKYFPFMETEFYNALTTMNGNAWVIFDRQHLGKWG